MVFRRSDLKNFINDEEMDEVSHAESLFVELKEKYDFADTFSGNDINDDTADAIRQAIDVLVVTRVTEKIKKGFESICIDTHLMKCDQKPLQKSICTRIAYTIFSIEKYRDITVMKLINLLQATSLKGLNEAYLITQGNQKKALKQWISDNFNNFNDHRNVKVVCDS